MKRASLLAVTLFIMAVVALGGCNKPQGTDTSSSRIAPAKPAAPAKTALPTPQKGVPKLMELGAAT
jgi:hypothetical protein